MDPFGFYIRPLFQGLVFVIGIYAQKFIRKSLYPKQSHPQKGKQFKLKWRIGMMLIVTLLLMSYNYFTNCQSKGISPGECFYLLKKQQTFATFIVALLSPFIANMLLFSYHIYERVFIKHNFTWQKLKDTKAIFWAPILQQLLFRASFYRASQQNVSSVYLSLIFSIAHFHRFVWKKIINKKDYPLNQTIGQSLFTFVFGLYSFFFLQRYDSVLSCIVLHCMCNFFGPPSFNKKNIKYHIIAITMFILYLSYFVESLTLQQVNPISNMEENVNL